MKKKITLLVVGKVKRIRGWEWWAEIGRGKKKKRMKIGREKKRDGPRPPVETHLYTQGCLKAS